MIFVINRKYLCELSRIQSVIHRVFPVKEQIYHIDEPSETSQTF